MADPEAPSCQRSNDFARWRDVKVIWLLGLHPVTAAMLVRLGLFPSRAKALRRLRRLAGRGRLRLVGTVCRNTPGRPEHVWCRWRPKPDNLLHEIELTELSFRLDAGKILRGPHVVDRQVLPDAEVWINGQPYYLELDRATMPESQVTRRFWTYEACPYFSLWVCSSVERRDRLRAMAEKTRRTALFTTFAEALTDPHREIWVDYQGGRAALPREGNKGG
jgi:hypothetical protein